MIFQKSPLNSKGGSVCHNLRMVSIASTVISPCVLGSGKSNNPQSVATPPCPNPQLRRPRERWSRNARRTAVLTGWCCGIIDTPVPRRMCFVRGNTLPMNTSLDGMGSHATVWCWPIHASVNPNSSARTIKSMSSSKHSVRSLSGGVQWHHKYA